MRKPIFFITLLFSVIFITACDKATTGGCNFDETDTIKICTTLFPQYDFAKQIGGDKVDVQLLVKPGVEPHDFDPKTSDIINLNKADLFIYTNPEMEPWVTNSIMNTIENDDMIILNASQDLILIDTNHIDHEDEENHQHGHLDPHVWTSIQNAITMIETIFEALSQIDPDNIEYYQLNARHYSEDLAVLDQKFVDLFKDESKRTIIHGGHAAMGYFSHDYDLNLITAFDTFSPNEELKIENIKALIDLVKEYNMTVIYHEELIDNKTAEMLKAELLKDGITVELKLLHGLHNISKQELANGVSYYDLMLQNYENLKAGLE